jgi:hypothetical protein
MCVVVVNAVIGCLTMVSDYTLLLLLGLCVVIRLIYLFIALYLLLRSE